MSKDKEMQKDHVYITSIKKGECIEFDTDDGKLKIVLSGITNKASLMFIKTGKKVDFKKGIDNYVSEN